MIEMVKGDFFIRTIVSFETAEILESNEIKNCSSRPEIRSSISMSSVITKGLAFKL